MQNSFLTPKCSYRFVILSLTPFLFPLSVVCFFQNIDGIIPVSSLLSFSLSLYFLGTGCCLEQIFHSCSSWSMVLSRLVQFQLFSVTTFGLLILSISRFIVYRRIPVVSFKALGFFGFVLNFILF